ncbi:MAG: hypothetical protein ABJN95_11065 [Maribacter sp.]|uniref:hypothetical protein n=1 Tax=Maribacter sp. TaxID=1897614 RepID=UPI003298DB42
MSNNLETPWNFANESLSPNGKFILQFGYVGEVAMGAPLSGECFLLFDNKKFTLNGMFGGPIVWNEISDKAAIPYWTENRFQKLAIIDMSEMKIYISDKDFRVIQLDKFKNDLILGIDSPIYRTEKINYDFRTEKYVKVIEVK